MVVITTEVKVDGLTGQDVSRFLLNCSDADYQRYWPGTHLAFHTSKRMPGDLGNLVCFDEYVGKRRLKFDAVVTEVMPGKRIVWQMKKLVKLSARLTLDFEDEGRGVHIRHCLAVGFDGIRRIFDPLIRIYLSKEFEFDIDQHVRTEFTLLSAN